MSNVLALFIALVAIFVSFFILAFLIHNREQKNLVGYDGQLKSIPQTDMKDLVLVGIITLSILSLFLLITFYVNQPKTVSEDYMNQRKDLVRCCTTSSGFSGGDENQRCCQALKDFDDKYGDKLIKNEK